VLAGGITADSRRIGAGDLFAAWPGFVTDGRRFIADAVERGAVAVLWDSGDGFDPGPIAVPAIGVEGLRELAGAIAHEIYHRPSRTLWVAGVTGTNGKTTVSQWTAAALEELGMRCGVIGTLGSGYPGRLGDALNTTPDALELHRKMAQFVADEADSVAMEVSSIGIEQGRVNAIAFDVAVFTNLTRDHLDYHGSMERYGAAKARLFEVEGLGHAVINLDDAFGLTLARRVAARGLPVIGYTRTAGNGDAVPQARLLVAENLHASAAGLRFGVRWGDQAGEVQARLVGPFNVSNLLAVIATLLTRGIPFSDALRVAGHLAPPEGRMQLLGGVGEPLIVVDYAHTPDALAKVLEAVRGTARTREGVLTCVFGCGGDRDPGKRPIMGEVASRLADRCILTSDNPRSENPQAIIDQIRSGTTTELTCILDRARAIEQAVGDALADDVIVIAGKGHEPYQEVCGVRHPFSDIEQARNALREWNRKRGMCP